MYSIDFQYEIEEVALPIKRMTRAICDTLDGHEIHPDTALSVVISSDEHVRELNRQYRQVDSVTDILSFPAGDPLPSPDELDTDAEPPYLGDLIIAYSYTQHQAQETGHALDDELVLLVIHGTLHLLDYDHDTPEHQDEMWAEQSELLARAGVPIIVPRFTFGDEGEA